jgi:hypothetical protein
LEERKSGSGIYGGNLAETVPATMLRLTKSKPSAEVLAVRWFDDVETSSTKSNQSFAPASRFELYCRLQTSHFGPTLCI